MKTVHGTGQDQPLAKSVRAETPDVDPVVPAIGRDGRLFPAGKMEVHRSGQQHLAVSVFVFCGDQLLIQRRAHTKYHCGGLWANTCCTHPHWGEDTDACASRRLFEEVGLRADLYACGVVDYRADVGNGLVENERVHVFRGDLSSALPVLAYNRAEVRDVAWVSMAELRRQVSEAPQRFTPWIRIYLSRWSELALQPVAC